MLTHLSLFSGIGGLDLAAEWAGFTTVGQCEWADYPTKVLEKHWPDVPRWRDIRTLTGDDFYARTGRRTVDVISGGFPCQPFSVAGKRAGKEDDRYLWPEMLRVIRELKPRWVVGENVPGIINLAADDVCADLECAGYEVWILNFEAAAVGAPHRRGRIAFVARNANRINDGEIRRICGGQDAKPGGVREDVAYASIEREGRLPVQPGEPRQKGADTDGGCEVVPDAERHGLQRPLNPSAGERAAIHGRRSSHQDKPTTPHPYNAGLQIPRHEPGFDAVPAGHRAEFCDWWSTEPDVGRVANGIPSRVDRLKCLGNAVVPQQFYPIFAAIAAVDRGDTP